jgi:hypothetical protein
MADGKKRLTIDLDARLHRWLKARAALEGTSVRELCVRAIERELERCESRVEMSGEELVGHLRRVRREIFGDRVVPDSTELIRQMREERSEYLWSLHEQAQDQS